MSFESEFVQLMPHSVTIEPWASQDAYGKPTYGAGVAYPAQVMAINERVVTVMNREVVASTQVIVGPNAGLYPPTDPRIRITLPDGSKPTVLAVTAQPDEDGTHHVVVLCGAAS